MNESPDASAVDILLVEDNPNDAELTIRAIKKHNLANEVFWVKDGEEALKFIFADSSYSNRRGTPHPKVLFLDLKLPKVDGLEILRRVRGDERSRLLPVVVLTSSKEEQDIVESYRLGVNSYIVKPVDFDKFLETVSKLGLYWLLLNEPPPSRI